MAITATPARCPDCDWAAVWQIIDGNRTRRVGCRHDRDAVVTEMVARRRTANDVARALHISHRRAAALIRCVLDARAWPLDRAGPCDRCQSAAEWQVTCLDGTNRQCCAEHAAAALDSHDTAGIPA